MDPEHARLTMFGPDGNTGLALETFELCQSNETMAWEMAAAKLLEQLHAVRQVLITREAKEHQARLSNIVTRAELDASLKEKSA